MEEKVARSLEAYQSAKERYESPGSREYKNSWFKKKVLDPAFAEYEKAGNELTVKKGQHDTVPWEQALLKIVYRVGMLMTLMVFVHGLFWQSCDCNFQRISSYTKC